MEDALISYFGTDPGDLTADEMHGREPVPVPRPSEEPLTEDELSVKVTRAYAEIHALCHGKRWLMSIPVRPEADSDTIICDALRALKDRVKILEAELARRSPSVPTAIQEHTPKCECGKIATCYGAYENQEPDFSCDECCGHGNEDGWCKHFSDMPTLTARLRELRGSEEAANSDTEQSAGEIIVDRDEWYAAKKDAERMNWLESKVDHQAADAYLRLEFDTHKTLREAADDERPAARVQGENSQ